MPLDQEECQSAWSKLVHLLKRYKSIVEGMERRQTAERQCKALIVSSEPSFASVCGIGGKGGTGGISFFKAFIEHLKGRLNAVVGGLWNVVTVFG